MSNDVAIKVENLSKRYRIGLKEEMHNTFCGAITSWIKSPFSNFKRLRQLSKFAEKDDGEDIIWALRDLSFEVKHGEVIGIIGGNGAGKSTLLKIISRITEPTSGRIILNGRVSSLLEVGTGFHPELTGRENVYLNGAVLGMSKTEIDRKFDEIVAFSDVEKFLDTPVKRYSSGMRVRLAFAVAAHLEPEILLIDEVLAVGDAQFQKKCLGKMSEVSREGRTVLFVSHNMSAVQQLCDRALLLTESMISIEGSVEECISQYLGIKLRRSWSILSHVEYKDSSIKLNAVSMNGSECDEQNLPPICRQLDIAVSGNIDRAMRLLIEARIYDSREQCLAFFTPRQYTINSDLTPAGPFHLNQSIALPRLNQGEYYLSMYISEASNTGRSSVCIPKAVRIFAEGTPTQTGWTFKYAKGNGWMLLSSSQHAE